MKYFKKFDEIIESKVTSDHDFSVLSLFKPILSLFKFNFVNIKLSIIGNKYDSYLNQVYKEYLKNKKDIEKNTTIEPVNDEDIISISADNEPLTYDVPSNTTHDFKPIPPNNKDNNSSEKEPIVPLPDEISSPIELDVKSNSDEDYSDKPSSIISNYIKNNDIKGLKQEISDRKEESEELNKKISDLDFRIKDLTKNKNLLLKKANGTSSKIVKTPLHYEVRKNEFNDDIKKLNIKIEKLETSKGYLQNKLDANKDFLKEAEKHNINESVDWKAGAVHNIKWSDRDVEKITRTVNTYQIEEFYIEAEYLIDKCEDKDKAKAKLKWNTIINNINKKWYYTFNVKELRNATIKHDDKDLHKVVEMNVVMSKVLTNDFLSFKSPYKGINEDPKQEFYILSVIDNLYLCKKITYDENRIFFYLMCELVPSKDNKRLVVRMSTMYNNIENYIKINIKGNRIKFYKQKNEFPIIMIEETRLYPITDDLVKDYNMKLDKNSTLYNISQSDLETIFKNSQIKTPKFKKDLNLNNTLQKIK